MINVSQEHLLRGPDLKVFGRFGGKGDIANDQRVAESVANCQVARRNWIVRAEAGERSIQEQPSRHHNHMIGDDYFVLAFDHNGAGKMFFFVRDISFGIKIIYY